MKTRLLTSILSLALLCGCKEDNPVKIVGEASKYYHHVDNACRKAIIAYRNSNDLEKGKDHCLQWCDSLESTTGYNMVNLPEHAFNDESELMKTAMDLNSYLNKISKNDLKEYILMIYTDQDYTHGYEVELQKARINLNKQYTFVSNKYFVAKRKFVRKYGILF